MKHWLVYLSVCSLSMGLTCSEPTPQNTTQPCVSYENHGMTLFCNNLTDDDILEERVFLFVDSDFQTFNISNSVLTYIPSDAEMFKDMKTIYIAQSSLKFFLADVPPSNLDTIIIDDVEFEFGMSWEYFEDMHNLSNIIIRNTNIFSLDAEFERSISKRLVRLMLKNTNTSHMSDNVFKEFIDLTDLRIESSHIQKLKRDMFSMYAEDLRILSFEDNKISYLPEDLFLQMPNLKIVDFSYNHIKELPITLFDIISNLNYLSLEGNPLNCDCNMEWIVWKNITWEETFNGQLEGVCKSPQNVTGVELRDLMPVDFIHCPEENFLNLMKKLTLIHINQIQRLLELL